MTNQLVFIAALTVGSLLMSCKGNDNAENGNAQTQSETTASNPGDIVVQSLTDSSGNTLEMKFDNAKDNVTISYKGETAVLVSQRPASGIWYMNDQYELSGKGNDITLSKNGNVIFEHRDNIVEIQAKNTNGDILYMTFNNTEGTVKLYLNGGEQIELAEQKAASGIWYKNDHYELSGKGDHYELIKDGKTVFKN